jgi:WD40 repeat protein
MDNGSDCEDEDEDPDLMVQVFNAMSSIEKIGYINDKSQNDRQLFAITTTNDLFVWNLESHDLVYRSPQMKTLTDTCDLQIVEDDDNTEYYFDCFYTKSKKQDDEKSDDNDGEKKKQCLSICKMNKSGEISIYQDDQCVVSQEMESKTHKDMIRSSYWNGKCLITGGEDGLLIKWNIHKDKKLKLKRERDQLSDDFEKDLKLAKIIKK